jgi:hypothetical protein
VVFTLSYLAVDLRGDFALGDDGVYIRMARTVVEQGRVVPPVEAVAPALSDSYLMAIPGALGADGIVWMRWLSVLVTALAIWMLGDAVRLRTARWSLAVAAQAVMAVSPVHYALTGSVMTDMHSLAFFVMGYWSLERARHSDSGTRWAVVNAASSILFVLSRTTGLLFAPLWWWAFRATPSVSKGSRGWRRDALLAALLVGLPVATFGVVRGVRSRASGDLLEDDFLRVATVRSIGDQVHNLSGLVSVSLLYTAMFVAPLLVLLVVRWTWRRRVSLSTVAGLVACALAAFVVLGAAPDSRFPFFGSRFTSRSLGIAEFASNPPPLWPAWFANALGVALAMLAVSGAVVLFAVLRNGGTVVWIDATMWLAVVASIAVPSAWSGGAPLDRYAVPLVVPALMMVTTALRLTERPVLVTRTAHPAVATLITVGVVSVFLLAFDVTALRDTFTVNRAVHDRVEALRADGVDPRSIDAGPGFAGLVAKPISSPPDLDRRTCLGHWWNAVLSPDSRVDWVFAYTDVPGFETVERIPLTTTWRSDAAILLLRYEPRVGRCAGFDDDAFAEVSALDPIPTNDG